MAEVRAFLATMAAQGYSTSTIRCTRGVLRLALRRAQEDDRLVRNVADLAEVPTGKRRQGGSMSREQMNALLGLDLDAWWRAYLTTAFTTGMRVGELLALSWDDVDFDAGVIRVRHSLKREHGTLLIGDLKTQSSKRTMQMPAAVAAARLAAPDWQDCGLVFCSPRNGRPKWHSLVDGTFKRLCEQAGIGGHWQLRETRHSFVSILSHAGVNIEAIADAAGHVNSNVTRAVYRHQLGDTITTAAVVWNDLLPAQEVAQ